MDIQMAHRRMNGQTDRQKEINDIHVDSIHSVHTEYTFPDTYTANIHSIHTRNICMYIVYIYILECIPYIVHMYSTHATYMYSILTQII